MSRIFQLPRQTPLVSSVVSPGAKANFFLTGTTTRTNTFTDSALGTPHANPVIANAAGEFATIYLDPDIVYKLTLDDTNDVLIYTEDPIQDALTQANIGLIFYPRTAAEISAGVTPTSFQYPYANAFRYMTAAQISDVETNAATGDVAAAIRVGISVLVNNTTLILPQGTYLAEGSANSSSFGLTGTNDIVAGIEALTNVKIVGYGASLKQTSSTTSTLGAFLFHDCIDSGVVGLRMDGVFPHGASLSTCGVASFVGACDGCFSDEISCDGGRGLVTLQSGDGTPDTTGPTNSHISGVSRDTEYGVNYTHCGYGHSVDIVCDNPVRSCFITGTSGISGSVRSISGGSADINISTRKDGSVAAGAGDVEDIDLILNLKDTGIGVELDVSDATACNLRNIRLSGVIETATFDGVRMNDLGNTGTVFENIDMSGLTIISPTGLGVDITPDVAGTMKNIKLPDVKKAASTCIDIDNTANAVIEGIEKIGGEWEHTGGIAANLFKSNNGTVGLVKDVRLIGVKGRTNQTGTIDFDLRNVDNLTIDGCVTPKEIFVVGCTNINPLTTNDHSGLGYIRSTNLPDGINVTWHTLIRVTGASNAPNNFNRGVQGQRITIYAAGGTPTITDNGTVMEMAGGVNFTMAAGGSIDMICTLGGELSEFKERSRSVA